MGKSSRTKGHNFERSVAAWFRRRGIEAERGWQSRGGGRDEPDVKLPSRPDLHIECKRPAKCGVYKYVEQALAEAGEDQTPVVILRADRKPMIAIMLADDWLADYGGGQKEDERE